VPERGSIKAALAILSENECLTLAAAGQEGRIALVADGRPVICPVNYVVSRRSIIFRTNWPMLGCASLASLAFQTDGADVGGRSRWMVMIQGIGNDITDALDLTSERLQTIAVSPWAPGRQPRLIRLLPATVIGYRFRDDGE
jgi:uncharacterized protein